MPHLPGERYLAVLSASGCAPAPALTSRFPKERPQSLRFLCTTSLPTPAARSPPETLPADHPAPGGASRYPRCVVEALRDWTARCPTPGCPPPARPTTYDSGAARCNSYCERCPAARCRRHRNGSRQRSDTRADTLLARRPRHRVRCELTSAPGYKRRPCAGPLTTRIARVCSVAARKPALVPPDLAQMEDRASGDFIPGNLRYRFHQQLEPRHTLDAYARTGRNVGRSHSIPDLAAHQHLPLRFEPRARNPFFADHPIGAGQYLVAAGLDHNRNQ